MLERIVFFIVGVKEYLRLNSVNERIMILMTFSVILNILPVSKFFRVHKSYIVYIDKIDSIGRSRIVIGEKYIPISDSYKDGSFSVIND